MKVVIEKGDFKKSYSSKTIYRQMEIEFEKDMYDHT